MGQYMEMKQLLCMSIMRDDGAVQQNSPSRRKPPSATAETSTECAAADNEGSSPTSAHPFFPLRITFKLPNGSREEVSFSKRPLGLDFSMSNPMKIKKVHKGSFGDKLGVKGNWTVAAVNGEDISDLGFEQTYS